MFGTAQLNQKYMKTKILSLLVVLMSTLGGSVYAQSRIFKDALIKDLKGHVKSCTLFEKNDYFSDDFRKVGTTIDFYANGKIINNSSTYRRNAQNQITQVTFQSENFAGDKCTYYIEYEYNNGKVKIEYSWYIKDGDTKKECETKKEYYYNSKGDIVKCVNKDLSGSGRVDLITEYKYLSFDDKGNWILREYQDPWTLGTCTEKRVIEYY